MALPNQQLFLDRFIAFNKRRYSDDPQFVAELSALTLDKITFSNFREVELGGGVTAHYFDVDSATFEGVDQRFLPADYAKNGPAQLEDETPMLKEDLETKTVQGIYFLGTSEADSVGAVLVLNGQVNPTNIKAIVKEKCFFDLKDEEITVSEDLTTVTIDSQTIEGVLQVVECLYDGLARFNGQYRYNGEITY